jgi:GntR family transcriptional regulator/MocR family aminotransferase
MSVLKEACDTTLPGILEVTPAATGMRTIGWLQASGSDEAAAQKARALGLEVMPLSAFSVQHAQKPGLILGFAACSPEELRRGADVLARALRPDPA